MILTLDEAKKINPDITQLHLDALETSIREMTNNNFQLLNTRKVVTNISSTGVVDLKTSSVALFKGDTVQINGSQYNDGLYIIEAVQEHSLSLKGNNFIVETSPFYVTKVFYPDDIKLGVEKLINYDLKMADKIGIKSQTIARMSTTYFDQSKSESINGYPATLMDFTQKYLKMRW